MRRLTARLKSAVHSLKGRVRNLLRGRVSRPPEAGGQSAAHPRDEHAPEYHAGKDALKDWYTSHWDLDMLPREELEKIARQARDEQGEQSNGNGPHTRHRHGE